MPSAISITDVNIFTVLRSFLLNILPTGIDVVRGQINRVPQPDRPDYVVMTPLRRERLSSNKTVLLDSNPLIPVAYAILSDGISPFDILATRRSSIGTRSVVNDVQMTIQLDFHGPRSTDLSSTVEALFRDDYASEEFDKIGLDIHPLYCSELRQLAFTNDSDQIEDRWSMDMVIQFNPVVSVTQEFADQLKVGVISVDASYPPGVP